MKVTNILTCLHFVPVSTKLTRGEFRAREETGVTKVVILGKNQQHHLANAEHGETSELLRGGHGFRAGPGGAGQRARSLSSTWNSGKTWKAAVGQGWTEATKLAVMGLPAQTRSAACVRGVSPGRPRHGTTAH